MAAEFLGEALTFRVDTPCTDISASAATKAFSERWRTLSGAPKRARHRLQRYGHARQFRRMRHEVGRLRTCLGRVYRDVGRKIAGNTALERRLARLLDLIERLLSATTQRGELVHRHPTVHRCICKDAGSSKQRVGGSAMKRRVGRQPSRTPRSVPRRPRGRSAALLGLLVLSVSGCVSSAGVPEFRAYTEAFEASQQVSTAVLDELAVVERQVAKQSFEDGEFLQKPADEEVIQSRREAAADVRSRGYDPKFYVEDARWISEFGDPPITASYRRALAVVADFNTIVTAYAEGRALDELKAEAAAFGAQATQLVSLIEGVEGVGSLAPPGVGVALQAIRQAVDLALEAGSREAFRTAVLQEQPRIDQILAEVQRRTPAMFLLVTADHQDVTLRPPDAASERAAIDAIETYRSVFANWVVLLEDTRAALRDAVAAIEAPQSELALLRDLNTSAVELRVRSEVIHGLLVELRQPGQGLS